MSNLTQIGEDLGSESGSCNLLCHDSMCSPGHCIWDPRSFSYRVYFGQLSLSADIRLGSGSWNPSDSHTCIPLTHKRSSAPSSQGPRFLPAPSSTILSVKTGFPGHASGNKPTCQSRRHRFDPWIGKITWSRAPQPTSVFFLGKSHEEGSLAGYSPGVTELDTTEQLSTAHWNIVRYTVNTFSK